MPKSVDARTGASVVWQQQSRWSQAAGRHRAAIARARAASLGLTVAAAVSGTAASQLVGPVPLLGRVLAFLAALAVALAALAQRGVAGSAIEDWTRLRAVSEALKAEVYVYLARVGRYRAGDRDQALLDRVDEILADAPGLDDRIAGIAPVHRELPEIRDAESYLRVRVQQQISGYYRPRETATANRGRLLRRIQLALAVVAAGLAAFAVVAHTDVVSAWIGVATTVTAAVVAYAAASRFEFQQLEYARTANELERLHARWVHAVDRSEPDDDEIVQRAERVISIQNDSWMVTWTRE